MSYIVFDSPFADFVWSFSKSNLYASLPQDITETDKWVDSKRANELKGRTGVRQVYTNIFFSKQAPTGNVLKY